MIPTQSSSKIFFRTQECEIMDSSLRKIQKPTELDCLRVPSSPTPQGTDLKQPSLPSTESRYSEKLRRST
jgi:hypothetical protein